MSRLYALSLTILLLLAAGVAAQTAPPELAPIGAQSVDENVSLNFGVSATDVDATTPVLSTSALPTGATFTDNLDGTGTFDWTPDFTQAGVYSVTFYAADAVTADVDSEIVAITVNNVNQDPVLAGIGAQSTTENVPLSFGVSASDADGQALTLTTSTLPTGASFTDNLDGTGTFDWTPTYLQSGSYNVTFRASDGVATDSEIVAITVLEAGNQSPILGAIGAQATDENVLLSFGVSATDVESTPVLTTSTLPTGAAFTDNLDGTGTFNWTPDYTQAGAYSVTFYATDDSAAVDSEVVAITVNNVNQDPILAAIGAQSTSENVLLSFGISASDADGQALTLSTSTLPTGASFTDNLDGTGTFSWTPGFDQAGLYSVTFRASDGVAIDSEIVAITVTETNQAPVLAAIGAQSTGENVLLTFGVSATDPDGTTPTFTTSALPTGATFVDNGDGTGSFNWTPDYTQAGTYDVTFRASDGIVVDSEIVSITVTNVNQEPILAAIGAKSVDENSNLNFAVSASDADGQALTLSTSTLPTGATFVDNGNGTGSFDWTPTYDQAGSYDVTFRASDGVAVDSEIVAITVTNVNRDPILAAIGPKAVSENVLLSFGVSASDPDGQALTLSTSTLPTGATFTDNLDGTGSFDWTPTFAQAGSYDVTFRVSDGVAVDSEIVTITVTNVNQDPILATIGAQSTTENVLLSFAVSASDGDGQALTLTTNTLPTGASFIDNGDGTGVFTWTPTYLQSGSYNVTFRASDGVATDSEIVAITVIDAGNQSPVLSAIGAQSTTENVLLSFSIAATDIESTPSLTTSALPTGASFVDNGDGTGSFSWTPTYLQSGSYSVTFRAVDDSTAVDSEVVAITVFEAGNQLPVLAAIGPQTTTENVLLTFGVSASDIESTPALSALGLPTGASFVDNGDGTGSFSWTPTFVQAGIYNVTFQATDDSLATDDEIVAITVTEAGNQSPVLAPIGAQSTTENVLLSFGVSASDLDGTIPSFTTSTLPSGASFVDNGDGTGSFDWTPGFTQAGVYNVTFRATDGVAIDSEIVAITVIDAGNQVPVLAAIGSQSTTENILLTFGISASDPDATIPALSVTGLPTGASFIDNGDGTGSFSWTPTFVQAGTYNVTFTASDGLLTDQEIVTITVNEAGNQAPVLAAIGPQSTTENVLLTFGVSATDPDETTPALSATNLPSGANFVDNGDGTGTFTWTPTFVQAGTYNVTFTASDGTLTDQEIVETTVTDAGNQSPVLAGIGPKTTDENVLLTFGVSATDAESTPTLSATNLPTGAGFVDNGDGTGTFAWTPTFAQAGIYNVTFTASDGSASDDEIVTITVNNVNLAPVLASIGPRSTDENVNLNFTVSASDPDATIPALSASPLPTGATFVDNGNGTGTFNWTPSYTDSGSYNVTFTTSDGSLTDEEIVTITVNNVNRPPILAAIGPKNTTENVNLNFGVSASDPDGEIPLMTSSTVPAGASFTDNGDGTGTFNWTPDFTQEGSYNVTFYATDAAFGAAVDSEQVTITVSNTNQEPILAAIGAKSVDENVNLNFGVSASDADGVTPVLTTSALPTGATFADNGNGTGTFNWTPTYVQSGVYSVTFRASDGVAADSEVVAITVNEVGNQHPVLAAIGNKSITEGIPLNFGVSSTDPESIPTLTTSLLPSGATFTDNGDGSGGFSWTPGYTQSGTYLVMFYARDDSLAVDSELVQIFVLEAGNQAPVLATIGPQTTTEDVNLNFNVTATDPDGTIPGLTATGLPTGASFTDNGNGTGTFNWTPSFTDAGVYNVTFRASDGSLNDQEIVTITVLESGNQAPVLAAIGPRSTTEEVQLLFSVSASDPDGQIPALTATGLPTGASFVDNGDGTGTFDWTPTFTQSGVYNVTFTASDGVLTDQEIVTITVNDAGNQAPVLAAIGPKSTTENILLTFGVSASDPDGQIPALTATNLPTGASFVDNGNGTGTFTWTPSFTDAGVYNVTFTASDGTLTDDEIVTITVIDAGNQAPVLDPIGARSTTEGVALLFSVTSSDPDGTFPALSATNLPTGASFIDNGDGTGSFSWTPTFVQAGAYNVTFTASDGTLTDQEIVTMTVNEAGNQAPVLAAIGPRSTTEEVQLLFSVSASDPDGQIPALTATGLPTGASFVDNGDGTGTFDWTPTFTQSGVYNVTFTASDGVLTDQEIVAITVNDAGNQAPVLAAIGPKSTTENILLTFGVSASDPDGQIPALTATNLPTGASFVDNGNGTGTFTWTPSFTDAGVYNVTFTASDGALTDDEIVTITVNEAGNQSPVLSPIGPQTGTEEVQLLFAVTASDPDGTIPTLSATNLPTGANFTDNGDGTGTFSWTPTFVQAGTYNVTFTASDGSLIDQEVVAITINDAGNQAPVLDPIGAQATTEAIRLLFAVSASDADATIPALAATNLPTGAIFTDNGNGTGTFDWTPTFTQSGVYNVTFTASDGVLTDQEIVTITVNDAGNQAPVLAAIGPKNTTENVLLTFGVSASDPDGSTPSLSSSTLPTGASFIDNGDGTGTFSWTPTFAQAGTYNVTFTASDGTLTDQEIVAITVNEAGNQAPVLSAIGPQSTTENVLLGFDVTASDPDGTTPAFTTSTLPTGATFTDNGNGTGSFSWTPGFTQAGVYNVTFRATDGVAVDSETVAITVLDAGNQAPVLAAIGAQSTTENVLLTFGVSASDPDATIPALSATDLPTGASFIDNGDGTGSFTWTPTFTAAGTYNVTFTASDGSLTDQEIVTITVIEAGNQAPVLAAIGPRATTEEVQLLFTVTASDPDATIPTLSATNLPTGASFVDNGDGTGTFDWTPDFTQSGVYNVTFTASDGSLTDQEIVAITVVDAGNQAPVLAAIGPQSTTEAVQLLFSVSAADADATIPALSTSSLPTGATFIDNGDGTGTFDWTPGYTQAGAYNVTFRASDGVAIDSEIVVITVLDAGNQSPVLAPIGSQSTTENVPLLFAISASDPDETIPALSTSTLPSGAAFTDNGDGTGSFDWTPTFIQAGFYNVTFYASDGVAIDSELISITVLDAGNQPPVLDPIGAQATTEGVQLLLGVSASDPDATIPTLSTSALPTGATFIDNGDGTGTFDWTPGYTQAGVYNVTFRATDGLAVDSELVAITVVESGNQPPVLDPIGPRTGTEAIRLLFTITASDPDGSTPSFGAVDLPVGAVFTDNGNGTATFNWLPDFTDAGIYNVTFFASDGAAADSEVVTITIADAGNQAPVLVAIGPQDTQEGVQLLFAVTATDADGTFPVLTTSTLPTGALFTDNGDGTGTFDWTPGPTDAGLYSVTFYASDGVAIDSEIVAITVFDVNQLPVLAAIGDQATDEGVLLSLTVSASDVDGDIPLLSTGVLPTGAVFGDNADGTGTLTWTPTFSQAGIYSVTFYAVDAMIPTAIDSETVTITVNNVNRPPDLQPIGTRVVAEGSALNFIVEAVDPDGDFPLMTTSMLPGTATFTDNGDGTGSFSWVTTFADAGIYTVTFYATDALFPAAVDSEVVTIIVGEAGNQPPQWTEINDTTVAEGETLVLNVSAFDYEGDVISLTVNTTLDANNYTFVNNGDGTGIFTYTPDYLDAGLDSIRFIATDNASPPLSSVMKVAVTTLDRNQPPQFLPAGPFAVDALDTLRFTITAYDSTDADGGRIFLSVTNLPANARFTDNGNNTGTFWFAPTLAQVGVDTVRFIAVDDDIPTQTSYLSVVITVRQVNQPPVLAYIGTKKVIEGGTLVVSLSATDPDGTVPFFVVKNAPANSILVDNGNGTGTWTFTPNFVQSGLYYVEFRASDGIDYDKEIVLIQVTEAGDQAPVFTYVPNPSVIEGETLIDSVMAEDPDGDPVTLSIVEGSEPPNFTFIDQGDGTGIFEFSPDFSQSGTFVIQVEATAKGAADTTDLLIDVLEFGNHPPVLAFIQNQFGTELRLLTFAIQSGDIDGDVPILSTSPLPGAATFVDSANGKGAFIWTPSDQDAGVYEVMFYATDGDPGYPNDRDSQLVTINVADTNRLPQIVVQPNAPLDVNEGEVITRWVYASDPDGTIPLLSARLSGVDSLARNMSFVDSGNGRGVITFTPDYSQGNSNPTFYYFVFEATDAANPSLAVTSGTQTFRVYNVPQPPIMSFTPSSGPFTVTEGDSVRFTVVSMDPDGLLPVMRAENVPVNATVVVSPPNSLRLTFRPDYSQAGTYSIRIIAEDAATAVPRLSDTEIVQITVLDAGNQAPYWSGTYPTTVDVFPDIQHTTTVTAIDPDGLPMTLTGGPLIAGANFIDDGNGSGRYIILADALQVGTVSTVTFTVTDSGGLTDQMQITYRVMSFMRGDADSNQQYSLNDVVYLANYLFRGGPPPVPLEAGDVDMNGSIAVADLVYMINFLYKSGPRPPQ